MKFYFFFRGAGLFMNRWEPGADANTLRLRASLYSSVRTFFSRRGVLEVATPVLTRAGVTDVHIASIAVSPAVSADRYLRTSPEYFHKRLLASGLGDIYELGPVFRDGEAGRRHNPEFTMLEWYRTGWSYRRLMDETVELIRFTAGGRLDDWPVRKLSWREAFIQGADADPFRLTRDELSGLADDAPGGLERNDLLDWLFATRVQERFPARSITLIDEFPAEQAALARVRPGSGNGEPAVAERFELFLGSLELANGYQELTDAAEQRERFERDAHERERRELPAMPLDEQFLAALDAGLPECSGVALGVDRLLMVLAGCDDIRDVVAFAAAGEG